MSLAAGNSHVSSGGDDARRLSTQPWCAGGDDDDRQRQQADTARQRLPLGKVSGGTGVASSGCNAGEGQVDSRRDAIDLAHEFISKQKQLTPDERLSGRIRPASSCFFHDLRVFF